MVGTRGPEILVASSVPHLVDKVYMGEVILVGQLIIHPHQVKEIMCGHHSVHFQHIALILLHMFRVYQYRVLLMYILAHEVQLRPRGHFRPEVFMSVENWGMLGDTDPIYTMLGDTDPIYTLV